MGNKKLDRDSRETTTTLMAAAGRADDSDDRPLMLGRRPYGTSPVAGAPVVVD